MKKILFIAAMMTTFSFQAIAADAKKTQDMSNMNMNMNMNMSLEDREKMAVSHQNMATCLRTDQNFKICHDALKSECQSMMGATCSEMDMEKPMRKGMKQKK